MNDEQVSIISEYLKDSRRGYCEIKDDLFPDENEEPIMAILTDYNSEELSAIVFDMIIFIRDTSKGKEFLTFFSNEEGDPYDTWEDILELFDRDDYELTEYEQNGMSRDLKFLESVRNGIFTSQSAPHYAVY